MPLTVLPARTAEQRPAMSVHETEIWRQLVEERCGVYFGDGRLHHLQGCLWERMRAHGRQSYLDYYDVAASLSTGAAEWGALLECLLNRETGFFRCELAFRSLASVVLQIVRNRGAHSNDVLRLWSAGCSSGQETYSMAIAALEASAGNPWRIHVRGSDMNENALERARIGRYGLRAVEGIPAPLRKRYLTAMSAGLERSYQINDVVKALVEFDSFNLIDPSTWGAGEHDVIFCQNVLIYFREAVREEITHNLARRLSPGGFLFFGPGEMPGFKSPGIQTVKIDGSIAHRRVE